MYKEQVALEIESLCVCVSEGGRGGYRIVFPGTVWTLHHPVVALSAY